MLYEGPFIKFTLNISDTKNNKITLLILMLSYLDITASYLNSCYHFWGYRNYMTYPRSNR